MRSSTARSLQSANTGAVKRSSGKHQKAGRGRERASVFITTFEIKVRYFCRVLSSSKSAKCFLLAFLNKWPGAPSSKKKELFKMLHWTVLTTQSLHRVNVLSCRNRCTANSGWIVYNLWQVLMGNSLTLAWLYKQLNKVWLMSQLQKPITPK